jgi:SpoVK/Ycf46/Vps4 family AAA+-type ATPase
MALLATAAHSLAQQKSMDLGELVGDLFPNPVEQLLYSAAWADPKNPLYTQNLLAPTQLIDGRVMRIQLHPKVEGKLIPAALRRSIRLQTPTSPYFQIIDHKSIPSIPLHYTKSFDTERQQLIELLGDERLRSYFGRLQAGGMVPGLQVMLTGAAGTGKTELVRQLARQTKRNLLIVRLEETRDKYFGENEKNISRLFAELTATARAMSRLPIILFNEADSFFYARANRGNSLENLENSIVTQFLNELERFEGILFATTNYTASMDKAYDRRWAFKLIVPSPDTAVRQLLIHKLFRDFAPAEALNRIAAKHAFAPAQLNNVYRKLILHKPEHCNAELIEKLLLQELSGWARGRTPVGF